MHDHSTFQMLPESEYIVPDYSEHSMYPASQIVPKVVLEDEVVSEDNMTYEFPSEKTYTNLEASTLKQNKAMQLFSEEAVDLKSWVKKDPHNWSPREVMDWLYYTAGEANINTNDFRAHLFNTYTGATLCTMTKEQFIQLDPNHGFMLHSLLRRLLRATIPTSHCPPISTIFDSSKSSMLTSSPLHAQEYPLPAEMRRDALLPTMETADEERGHGLLGLLNSDDVYPLQAPVEPKCMKILGHHYDFDDEDMFHDLLENPLGTHPKPEFIDDSDHSSLYASDCSSDELAYRAVVANTYTNDSALVTFTQQQTARANYKRQPGRPRKNPPAAPRDPNRPKSTRGRKPGQRTKGNHLWEFMRDLLMNPRFNKTHVTWQDRMLGVFMIAKSAEVAQMWGQQKKNPSMTYEKMSRSMRFCRKVQYFQPVPKDGRFPKKLCFRFGPMAEGWEVAR